MYLRFLHDQQDCVIWHPYLSSRGDECMLAYGTYLDLVYTDPEEFGHITEEEAVRQTWVCALSFEAFLIPLLDGERTLFQPEKARAADGGAEAISCFLRREEEGKQVTLVAACAACGKTAAILPSISLITQKRASLVSGRLVLVAGFLGARCTGL